MTDIPSRVTSVPARLGVTARFEDGSLELDLVPGPELLHHGMVRASVISYVVDALAGISVDGDASVWTLTTDMSIRMRPVPAPQSLSAINTILRRGRRSVTSTVEVTTQDGTPLATGAIGFAHIPRKEDDPPKPIVPPEMAPQLFQLQEPLSRPLREEAGIEVVDAAEGVVQVELTPELLNPAGTLQGAMVALVAEAAAEDLLSTRFESPVVVTDLDLRYLAQTQAGPVRTRSRLLGTGPDSSVQVELIDTSTDRLTTLVYARAVAAT
jgi:acyl-coenzyme A thioesterase PaaI-like protein